MQSPDPSDSATAKAYAELERAVHAALETYSNVHRGSGHHSLVSTRLFEQARDIVLEFLGLGAQRYVVVFCTRRRAEALKAQVEPERWRSVSSEDVGLPLGVHALAIERRALPRGVPFETGGGTARLVSPDRITWARGPEKLEAGTPAIVNVIAFAKALRLVRQYGEGVFREPTPDESEAAEILRHDALDGLSGRALLAALRQTLIGRGALVPTVDGARPYVNLDNAASTPTFMPIWDAARRTWRQPRQAQQEIIREVRSLCGEFLGAPAASYEVLFTSNTTEAINLAAACLAPTAQRGSPTAAEPVVLNTLLEHTSNELPWRMAGARSLIRLPVDAEGFVDPVGLETVLREYNEERRHGSQRVSLVAVSGASNVLGTFNDLAEISRIAHRYGAYLLVDGAQLIAHRQVEMEKCEIDLLAFSAHKAYAPFGSGALVARKGVLDLSPSERERLQSSGEENVGGIAALGKALGLLARIGLDLIQEEERALTGRMLRGLAQVPGLRVFGIKDPSAPRFEQKGGVVAFTFKRPMANGVARALAERGGIGVRYGCHCAHLLVKHLLGIPPLLARFQHVILFLLPKVSLPGIVRASLGLESSAEDVDALLRVLGDIARAPRSRRSDVRKQMDESAKVAAQRVYALPTEEV